MRRDVTRGRIRADGCADDGRADGCADAGFATFASRARARADVAGASCARALEALDARAAGDGVLACAYVGRALGRYASRGEVKSIEVTCERYRVRVGERLRAARMSLEGGGEASARARACAGKVAAAAEAVEALTVAVLEENMASEGECIAAGDIASGAAPRSCEGELAERVPAGWRMACANAGAYLELRGVTPNAEQWARVRTVFDAMVAELDGEEACDALVRDDATWSAMKSIIDDSTTRPRRAAQAENNARYRDALEELEAAKKEWREAEKTYKFARQRIKRARHEVHRTRKTVRIEYR